MLLTGAITDGNADPNLVLNYDARILSEADTNVTIVFEATPSSRIQAVRVFCDAQIYCSVNGTTFTDDALLIPTSGAMTVRLTVAAYQDAVSMGCLVNHLFISLYYDDCFGRIAPVVSVR